LQRHETAGESRQPSAKVVRLCVTVARKGGGPNT
jgi:hypothetical protein